MRLLALLALLAPRAWTAESFPAELRLEAQTYHYRLYELKFPSPQPGLFPPNNTVWGHLYLPRPWKSEEGKAPPVVLVLPVMAAPNVWIEMRFVRALLAQRIAVLWIEMPYQFHRRPLPSIPSGQVFLARTASRLGKNFSQSMADARRALTWLQGSGLVDSGRIGVFGISLGSLVGSAVLSVDERPRAGVFALGGADFASLVMHSELTGDFVRASGIREEELRKAFLGLDPLEYRDSNRGKKVLLINASSDRVIPAENGRRLKEAFPDARQLWVPGGHLSALLHLTWVPSYVAYGFGRLLD